ncbi:Lrp/AsnC family transcriptional regulator [Marinobacterium mangrovicola]|nr:Lrp/AsnC family transcriptional regulator [Marinobacterium mangrovicola]
MADIDDFDRQILEIVQRSNRTTSDVIGEAVGLSPAAVQRRLKRMRQEEIIEADVSVVSRQAVNRSMTFIVQITLERERVDLLVDFKRQMLNNPHVQQCYYVTGSYDFIIILTAADMAAYEQFTEKFFFNNKNIKSFYTNVVMDSVKTGMYIPVVQEPV